MMHPRKAVVGLALLGGLPLGITSLGSMVPVAMVGSSIPSAGAFIPAPGEPSPALAGGLGRNNLKSENWSGYAQSAADGTFTAVQDSWTVPTVTIKKGTQYSSDWVGIGGFAHGDTTLVQAGTEADNIAGVSLYRAWTEILPAAEDPLSMVVSPGDSITVLVEETAADTWLMQVTDNTTSVTQSRTVSYASSGASVEAIHERPCLAPCKSAKNLATLSTTTDVTFDPGDYSTTAAGTTPAFDPLLVAAGGATVDAITMVKGSKALATPSASDSDNDGFTVADGKVAPPPPGS